MGGLFLYFCKNIRELPMVMDIATYSANFKGQSAIYGNMVIPSFETCFLLEKSQHRGGEFTNSNTSTKVSFRQALDDLSTGEPTETRQTKPFF